MNTKNNVYVAKLNMTCKQKGLGLRGGMDKHETYNKSTRQRCLAFPTSGVEWSPIDHVLSLYIFDKYNFFKKRKT